MIGVRVVKSPNGKSRGFGYVYFKCPEVVPSALALDRTAIEGRAMYVSPCEDKRDKPAEFKVNT